MKAGKQGVVESYKYLGTMYATGQGTSINKTESKKWFKKGMEAGDGEAIELYSKYFN